MHAAPLAWPPDRLLALVSSRPPQLRHLGRDARAFPQRRVGCSSSSESTRPAYPNCKRTEPH